MAGYFVATTLISPEILESSGRQRRIDRRRRDRAMPQPSLDCPGIVPPVGEGIAAGVSEHVRIRSTLCGRLLDGWRGRGRSRCSCPSPAGYNVANGPPTYPKGFCDLPLRLSRSIAYPNLQRLLRRQLYNVANWGRQLLKPKTRPDSSRSNPAFIYYGIPKVSCDLRPGLSSLQPRVNIKDTLLIRPSGAVAFPM